MAVSIQPRSRQQPLRSQHHAVVLRNGVECAAQATHTAVVAGLLLWGHLRILSAYASVRLDRQGTSQIVVMFLVEQQP